MIPSDDSYVDKRLGRRRLGLGGGTISSSLSWPGSSFTTVIVSEVSSSSVSSRGFGGVDAPEASGSTGGRSSMDCPRGRELSRDLSGIWKEYCIFRASARSYGSGQRLTGRRAQYAMNVAIAAMINTAWRAIAYESRALRWRSGGRFATKVAECRIRLIN